MSNIKAWVTLLLWGLVFFCLLWYMIDRSIKDQERANKCIESDGMIVEQYNHELCVQVKTIPL